MDSIVKQGEENSQTYTPGVEFKIIVSLVFLLTLGLIMVYSASSYHCSISSEYNYDSAFLLKKQLKNIIFGTIIMVAVSYIPYKIFRRYALILYIFSAGCIGLLKTGFGVSAGGATRWIRIMGFQVQVADIVKICMIIFMAAFVSKNWKRISNVKIILELWVFIVVQAALILLISSNLSSAIILCLMVFILTFIVSKRNKLHLAIVAAIGVLVVLFLIYLKNHLPLEEDLDSYRYQLRRFIAWIAPERYAGSVGYQPLQSLYAIGSGGLLGKGLGNGTQKLVNIPEAQNDMIFSIICEELGLVGAVLMFLIFGYLLYQMFVIVRESRDKYCSVVVMGVMLHISLQIIVNVCVAVNFFPNTGVSLPFISYGGSAILFTMAEMGLVIGARRQQMNKKYSRLD